MRSSSEGDSTLQRVDPLYSSLDHLSMILNGHKFNSDSEMVMVSHVAAGLTDRETDRILGAKRYLWSDDPKVFGPVVSIRSAEPRRKYVDPLPF